MDRANSEAKAMTQTPTKTQILLARLAVALIVAFAVLGVAMYGFSAEVRLRIWRNLLERPFGPMTFRFFLQPIMASIVAWRDGARDARTGRSPYFWTMLTNRAAVGGSLQEGLIATARILLLGLAMDVIYQTIVFETLHPGEAAIISILLAFVPYLLLRGPAARVAGWWRARRSANETR
jgi:tryptophan-rich sensory protein